MVLTVSWDHMPSVDMFLWSYVLLEHKTDAPVGIVSSYIIKIVNKDCVTSENFIQNLCLWPSVPVD